MKLTINSAIIFAILLFGVMGQSYASHIMGADITYTCVGGNDYQFTLTVYQDCDGITPGTSFNLNFESASCGQNFSEQLPQLGMQQEVSSICTSSLGQTTCNGGSLPGTMQWTYQATVTLPAQCNDWVISWNSCCRNSAITNLDNPGSRDTYTQVTMDNTNGMCNNSPQYAALPTPYICANQLFVYNHGAYDVDGDSLVYALVQPLEGFAPPGTPIPYAPGYTVSDPVTTTAGFNFNPLTGEMCFTPDAAQMCVIAVGITEYRNGVIIGTYIREMQVVVSSSGVCNNIPPFIGNTQTGTCGSVGSLMNLTGGPSVNQIDSNIVAMCPGDWINFELNVADPDPTQSVFVSSNTITAIPAATFTVAANGTNNPVATFNWVPTINDTGFNAFTVTVEDDACPIKGVQNFSFVVQVWDATEAGPDKYICGPSTAPPGQANLGAQGGSQFTWTSISGDPIIIGTNFSCNNCQYPIATPTQTTVYEVESNLAAGCKNKDTVTVFVVPDFTYSITQNKDSICLLEQVQFEVLNVNPPAAYSYTWDDPSGYLSATNIVNPIGTFDQSGYLYVPFEINNGLNCIKKDTFWVEVSQGVQPIISVLGDTTICIGDSTQLFLQNGDGTPSTCGAAISPCSGSLDLDEYAPGAPNLGFSTPTPYQGVWEDARSQFLYLASDLNAMGFNGGKIASIAFEVTNVSSTQAYSGLTISLGCTGLADLPQQYQTGLTQVASYASYNVVNGWNTHTFNTGYDWDGVSNLIVEVCYDNSTWTGSDQISVSGTTYNSAIWAATDGVVGCAMATPNSIAMAVPHIRFESCSGSLSTYEFQWSPPTGLSSTNIFDPMSSPPADQLYSVIVTDSIGGCADTAEVNVVLVPNFVPSFSQESDSACAQENIQLNVSPDTAGYTYVWSPGTYLNDSTIANPIASISTPGSYPFSVTITNSSGCDKDSVLTITVKPEFAPSITVTATDTFLCLGDQSTLTATASLAPSAILEDDFDPDVDLSMWFNNTGTASVNCGSVSGNALWFDVTSSRTAETNDLNLTTGGSLSFYLYISDIVGGAPCENADPGEDVVLEYSTNSGGSWTNIATYNEALYPTFTKITIPITGAMMTANTRFRWDQPTFSTCNGCDNWAIDSVLLSVPPQATPTYNWYITDGFVNPALNYLSTVLTQPDSSITYSVIVTGGACEDTADIDIYVTSIETINDTTSCSGDSVGLGVIVNGGDPNATHNYTWTPAANISDPSAQAPTASITTDSLKFYVTYTDGSCVTTDSMMVYSSNISEPLVTGIDVSCAGGDGQINITPVGGFSPYTYTLINNSTGQDSTQIGGIFLGLDSGNYSVVVTDAMACPDTLDVPIDLSAPVIPQALFSYGDTTGCDTLTVNFTDLTTNGDSCKWITDGITVFDECANGFTHFYNGSAFYDAELIVYSTSNCTDTLNIPNLIVLAETPNANFTWSPDILNVDDPTASFTDLTSGTATPNYWEWIFNDIDVVQQQSPSYTFPETPGEYPVQLIVSTPSNCPDTSIIKYVTVEDGFSFWMPTSFSPNGDGVNDVFMPKSTNVAVEDYTFEIYNRWGDLIFSASHPGIGWNGTNNYGQPVADGVYVWKVKSRIDSFYSVKNEYIGHVTIVR